MKPLRQHERSAKHIKAVQRRKLQRDIDEGIKKLRDNSDDESVTIGNTLYAECEVCDKEFNCPEAYYLHLKSKAHKKKSATKKVMDQVKEGGSIDLHKLKKFLKGKKKKSKSLNEEESVLQSSLKSDLSDTDESEADQEVFECKECEKVFSGLEPYYIHMSCKLHKKTMKQKALVGKLLSESTLADADESASAIKLIDEVLTCQLCHCSFSGPESAIAHLKSRGHGGMLQLFKWKKEQKLKKKPKEKSAEFDPELEDSSEQIESNVDDSKDIKNVLQENYENISQLAEKDSKHTSETATVSNEPSEATAELSEKTVINILLTNKTYKESSI